MNPEAFTAQRRERLSAADDELAPAVSNSLVAYLSGRGGWDREVLEVASRIWMEHHQAEAPGSNYEAGLARFRAALGDSLAKTARPDSRVDPAQVQRIARWISTYAVNSGTMTGAYARGIRSKVWLTMDDDSVRDIHRPLDGTVRPIGSTFDVAGTKLGFPGEPIGPFEVWIECRCVAMPASRTGDTMSTNTFDLGPAPLANPDGTPYTGALVVLVPADSDPITAASSEPAHVTTIWFGEMADLPVDVEKLEQAVRLYAQDLDGPVVVPVRERGTLGDAGADVAFLETTDSLLALRDGLLANEPVQQAYAAAEQFPEWTPHVTLGYPERPALTEYDATEVTFDRLSLWLGGEHYDYTMGGAVTAAAIKPAPFTMAERTAQLTLGEDGKHRHADGSPATDRESAYAIWGDAFEMAEVIADVNEPADLIDEPEDGEELITEIPVHGVLAPEGVMTGDGRGFREGALSTRPLPVPLRYEIVGSHGGNNTSEVVTVGRVDRAWRDEATKQWRYEGVIILTKPYAQAALEGLIDGSGTGVSIDADQMSVDMSESFDDDGNVVGSTPGQMDQTWFSETRVAGLTIVPIPAFHEAYAALGLEFEEDMSDEDLVAAEDALTACGCAEVEIEDLSVDPEANERAYQEALAVNPNLEQEISRLAAGGTIRENNRWPMVGEAVINFKGVSPELFSLITGMDVESFAPGTKDGPGWITHPIPTKRLRDYWTRGEGAAKIAWGTPGDFNRCRALLAKYVQNPDWLAGMCANMHKEVLKIWPAQHRGKAQASLIASGGIPAPIMTLVADAGAPVEYPSEWFANPHFKGVTPMHIDRETGRIWGHLAQWNSCHIGIAGACKKPPKSRTNYANFLRGVVDTDAGEQRVGCLTYGIGHANPMARAASATAHYDRTDAVVAYVNVGEDKHGIWFSGVLRPGLSEERITEFRAIGSLSGDWRRYPSGLDLTAAVAVNTPGYSLAASAAMPWEGHGELQMSLIAAGYVDPVAFETEFAPEFSGEDNEAFLARAALKMMDMMEQRKREAVVRDRVHAFRVSEARRRIKEKTHGM